MFTVALLFLTVNPDFFLPNGEFDRKYCEAEVEAVYSATSEGGVRYYLKVLRKSRTEQRERMLRGLSLVPIQPPGKSVKPAPAQAAPMFSVAMLFLSVHSDFYLPNEKFDPKYCKHEYELLLGTWTSYRGWLDSYETAHNEQYLEEVSKHLERTCYRIVEQLSELNDLRYYQRGRMLRGVPLHLYIER